MPQSQRSGALRFGDEEVPMAESAVRKTLVRKARPGGRSARVKAAVHQALLDELVAKPYSQIGIESVANRAGVHKTTIYRRWPTLEVLFAEVARELAQRSMPPPDTGSLVEDLRTAMRSSVRLFETPYGAAIARLLVGESGHSEALAEMSRGHWGRGEARVAEILRRGRERGELVGDVPDDLLIESLWAPLYLRKLVSLRPLTDEYVDRVIDGVLAPHLAPSVVPDRRS